MDISIGSYSFHGLLEAGKQDMFQYIEDCKKLGATQLDPWCAHLAPLQSGDQAAKAGKEPENAQLAPQDDAYLDAVKKAADAAGLPFGCVAVDGAHIYEEDEAARRANRALAYRWLDVSEKLGAKQVRIDAGGPEEMPDEAFEIIVAGYRDLIGRAGEKGLEILTENHWGPTQIPENVIKLLDAVDGLGLLFDSFNFAPGMQEQGWELCHGRARSTHFKTFRFDAEGNDTKEDIPRVVRMLAESGYTGCWGVESCPEEIGEIEAAGKTIALIKRSLEAVGH